jgi:hypothetical protein
LALFPATFVITVNNRFAGTMMAAKATKGVKTATSKLLTEMAQRFVPMLIKRIPGWRTAVLLIENIR